MILDILTHPYIHLPFGVPVCILIAIFISRRWILRGYLLWGIGVSALALLAAFWLNQFLLGVGYTRLYAETGPCSLCSLETVGYDFLGSWIFWVVGVLIFAAIKLRAIASRPKDRPHLSKRLYRMGRYAGFSLWLSSALSAMA